MERLLKMELCTSALENLTLASDTAHIPDSCFDVLVKKACQGVLHERERNEIAGNFVSSIAKKKNPKNFVSANPTDPIFLGRP